jgi:hypothetical protein
MIVSLMGACCQISVHTWFHQHLTTLTNAQIVAELGYTREIIKVRRSRLCRGQRD